MARFYRMSIGPTLFAPDPLAAEEAGPVVALTRIWGRIGTRGQMRHDLYPTRAEAVAALGRLQAAKLRRGYRPCP